MGSNIIEKARSIHGEKYDYSLVKYINARTKVKIVCPIHGIFEQTPEKHLSGRGCQKCGKEKSRLLTIERNKLKLQKRPVLTTEQFIEKAKKAHGEKYDYSLVKYINARTKVKIVCLLHGDFKQLPSNHLSGCGCPKCNESKSEKTIRGYLTEKNIKFISQKRFEDCKNIKTLPFDFYLPDYNICIEFDGIQHFELTRRRDAKRKLEKIKINDGIKNCFCKENNIKLLRISYNDSEKLESIIEKALNI